MIRRESREMENKDLLQSTNSGFFNQLIQFLRSDETQRFLHTLGNIIEGIVTLFKAGAELIDIITGGINRKITR